MQLISAVSVKARGCVHPNRAYDARPAGRNRVGLFYHLRRRDGGKRLPVSSDEDDEQRDPGSPWIAVPQRWSAETWERIARLRVRFARVRAAGRALVRRILPNESQHLFALTLAVGMVCGLVAVAFHLAIRAAERLLIERALHAEGSMWMFWTVLTPSLGGLLAGAALTWIVPGARGSGIPQVKQAFAVDGGRVRFRDALGKFIIGSVQIGSGASLGREGPTVQICAGATSLLARATSLPPKQMRRLTPVGVAAGIAAAFNAPIAAVTFTIEEVVGTLDQAVLSGVVVAAALAAVIERGLLGVHPVIEVDQAYGLDHASSLPLFAVLGIAAAFISVAFTDSLLRLRLRFRRIRVIPSWTHPGVGGLVTGVLAVGMLHLAGTTGVTGGGYDTLGRALAGQLGVRALLALCVIKLVATVFSYSSGGAGGIFAPSLFVGAMLGGAVGHLDVLLLGHESRQLGAFALVGMGAVFAGVIRAPITSVLIIFEMTGGYGLVLPLMLANMTSYVIARRLRPVAIYEALLAQDGVVLPHAATSPHPLEVLQVADAMVRDVVTLRVDETIADGVARVADRTFSRAPVVDVNGSPIGVVGVAQLRSAIDSTSAISTLLQPGHVIRSDAPLLRAIVRMNELSTRQLLVVDAASEARLVGILAMSDVVHAHARAAPNSLRSGGMQRRAPRLELAAGALKVAPVEVGRSTKLQELAGLLRDGAAEAFLVRQGANEFGVLLQEHVLEFALDESLKGIVIAADLARPAPTVPDGAGFSALVEALHNGDREAVVVVDDQTGKPVGIVSRNNLARALLDWYASRPSLLEDGTESATVSE